MNITMHIPTPVRDVEPGMAIAAAVDDGDYDRVLVISDVEIHLDSVDLWGRAPGVEKGQRARLVTKRDDVVRRVPTDIEARAAWFVLLDATQGQEHRVTLSNGCAHVRVAGPDHPPVVIGPLPGTIETGDLAAHAAGTVERPVD